MTEQKVSTIALDHSWNPDLPEVKDNTIKEPPPTTPETAASQDSSATPPQDDQAYTIRPGRISKHLDRLDT